MLRVVTNAELVAAEDQDRARRAEEEQNLAPLPGLVAWLRKAWDAAWEAKKPIQDQLLVSLRQRKGQYDETTLQKLKQSGGTDIFMRITEVKCRAAESWLRDILLEEGAPPWSLAPTSEPDLKPEDEDKARAFFAERVLSMTQAGQIALDPEQIMNLHEESIEEARQQRDKIARDKAERMQRRIKDQFDEGGWREAFNAFISDLATYKMAVLKGPVVRRRKKLKWEQGPDGYRPVVSDDLVTEIERVSPFDIFPEPGVSSLSEGYVFQRHKLPSAKLAALIGVPGYNDNTIRAILSRQISTTPWSDDIMDSTRKQLEERDAFLDAPTTTYEALEFWGKVHGRLLIDWGMPEDVVTDPDKHYDANIWTIGNYVLKATLNYDPLGETPYSGTSFIKQPGTMWGLGVPETIEDVQRVCNAAARSLVNNMAIASGPQVEISVDRLAKGEEITTLAPWRIWQTVSDPAGSSSPAVRFVQPDDRAGSLIGVYDKFLRMADDQSGIPAYIYGNLNVSGAGRTSSGLSMLMGAAGKGIRQVVMHIDADIILPIVRRQYTFNMRFDPDQSIKGDVQIIPRGATQLAMKDVMNTRRVEFLNATANPVDVEILGKSGRASLLREVAKGLQMPVDEVIPSKEKLALLDAMSAATPQQGGPQPAQGGVPLQPDGTPKGGQAGNQVTSALSGRP